MKHSDPTIQKIKNTLDQQSVDADTRQQLAQARQQALRQPQPWWRTGYAVPAMVMASLLAITLMVTLQLPEETTILAPDSLEAFELLSSNDELELYQDLEFYLWLDEQPAT